MFYHSETLALFGLTAFQTVPFALFLQNFCDFGMIGIIASIIIGWIIAFFASCLEMTLLLKLFGR